MRKLIICCLFFVLAACGQSGPIDRVPVATSTTSSGAGGAPASPTAEPDTAPPVGDADTATPTTGRETGEIDDPGEPFLTIQQEGGFAGIQTITTVDTSGALRVSQGRGPGGKPEELKLTPQQLSELRELVESDEFRALDAKLISQTCADCFLYTITVRHGDVLQVVQTDDAAEKPAPLVKLLELVNSLRAGQ